MVREYLKETYLQQRNSLRAMYRRQARAFLYLLDHEKVELQQTIFYVFMIIDGLYNTFAVSVPVQIIEESLGTVPWAYSAFLAMCILGPALSLLGKRMKGDNAYTGAWCQLVGDIGVFGTTTTYVAATIYTQYWGKGNFAGLFVAASALGSLFFIIRGIRRIAKKDRWEPVSDGSA